MTVALEFPWIFFLKFFRIWPISSCTHGRQGHCFSVSSLCGAREQAFATIIQGVRMHATANKYNPSATAVMSPGVCVARALEILVAGMALAGSRA